MKTQKLYKIAIKAMKELKSGKKELVCNNCFVYKMRRELFKENINYNYYNGSDCSNVLFYLEDLGIIEILQGVANRNSGVDCNNLKIKVLHSSEGNKI